MKPQTEQILTDSLTEILEFVKAGKAVAIEQGPLIVQDILRAGKFYTAGGAILILVSALLIAVCLYAAKKDEAEIAIISALCSLVMFVVGLCIFNGHALALIAPRLYVIDYLKGLL